MIIALRVYIDAQKNTNPADQAKKENYPALSAPTVAIPQHTNSPTLQSNAKQENADSEAKTFRISIVRDKYDWVAYGGNLALVAVGIGGVLVGIFTLSHVKRQSALMVAKERAKLIITLEPFDPPQTVESAFGYQVLVSVTNYGSSVAFIEKHGIYISVDEKLALDQPLDDYAPIWDRLRVIPADGEPCKFATTVFAVNDRPASDDDIARIRKGRASLYCIAMIEYSDVFDQYWEFCLKKKLEVEPFVFPNIPARFRSWVDWGEPHENGEYRLKKKKSEYPRPN